MVTQTGAHILLVEDDIDLAEWIADYLTAREFKVTTCHRGDEAVELISSLNPDIVLLDGMLPGMDGLDVCKAVRATFDNPIIMITARDEEIDEVLGLEMGADDYITKPVRARVLLARIRGLLRREDKSRAQDSSGLNQLSADELESNGVLQFSGLVISEQARSVTLDGELIKVSSNEFDVLWFLANKAGQVVSRKELVSHFRGFDYDGFDRSVDVRIMRLRQKIEEDTTSPQYIQTVWGEGYRFMMAESVT